MYCPHDLDVHLLFIFDLDLHITGFQPHFVIFALRYAIFTNFVKKFPYGHYFPLIFPELPRTLKSLFLYTNSAEMREIMSRFISQVISY